MKTLHKTILLLSMALASFSACEQEEMQSTANDGKVAIVPELAGMYAVSPGNWSSTRAIKHPALKTIINLPEGATLRLIAKKGTTTSTKDYVVRTAEGGSQSLYPCMVDANGNITNEDKTPLYLAPGSYTFSAVSPAHKYQSGTGMTIGNGESVIATNNRWTQTEAKPIVIENNDKSKVIPLNPLMQLTSRMTFTLKGGDGVSDISVMQDGIEIDRIRKNPVTLNNVGDSIKAEIADNYNRIYIKDSEIKVLSDESLWGEVCLLPIDNRPTPMFVILNVMVNGVPTQFTFSIVNKILYAGFSYDYIVNIQIKGGITVANWQETSWTTDVGGGETTGRHYNKPNNNRYEKY